MIRFIKVLLVVAIALSWRADSWGVERADLVLVDGRIVTLDRKERVASALAVRGGRIIAVGSDAGAPTLKADKPSLLGRSR